MVSLRSVVLSCAVVAGLGFGARAPQDHSARVQVTGTQVTLVPPSNFEPAERFPGFVGPNATIQVTEIAGPFKEVSAGFMNAEMLKKQDMTLLASESISLADGTPALWIHAGRVPAASRT